MQVKNILSTVISIVLLLTGIFLMPWQKIKWGKLEMMSSSSVTVIGEARGMQKNQIASFTAGVSANGEDKQTTIDEVNQKVEALITTVKNFGIKDEDIKTQNISVNEQENPIEINRTDSEYKWYVNNSIIITLRDVEKTSEFTEILSNTGANNIYGPNFRVDDEQANNDDLIAQAMKNAKEKAEKIAQASNRRLGKVINVSETGQTDSPIIMKAFEGIGGGGAPVEPGSSDTYKSIVVIFELE